MIKNLLHIYTDQKASILKSLLIYAGGLLIIAFIGLQSYIPISQLTRDLSAITGGKFYYGLLSNLGLLMWCAAASVCMFSSYILKKRKKLLSGFLMFSGALTLFLLLDDMFLFHEEVFPKYLGINEKFILAIYPLSICYLFLKYQIQILKTSYLILLSSLGFLALSMATDVIFRKMSGVQLIFEDGFKFLGIIGWFFYFTNTCISAILEPVVVEKRIVELYPDVVQMPEHYIA
ncbi:MAG: hypothetical protein H7096_02745 [Flavobacterium sp.]|nr:hypothetical protein [Pedobacter sp.]